MNFAEQSGKSRIVDIQDNNFQEPAKGDPKIPTASSIQTRAKTVRTARTSKIRWESRVTFLRMNSRVSPAARSKIPAATKSPKVQFTSDVNCMAIKFARRMSPVTTRTTEMRWFIMRFVPLSEKDFRLAFEGFFVPMADFFPVHYFPDCTQVITPLILILQVVRMFPNINT